MSKILRMHFANGTVLPQTDSEYLQRVVGEYLVAGIVLPPGEYDLKPALWIKGPARHQLFVFENGDAEYKTQDGAGNETKVEFPDDGDISSLWAGRYREGTSIYLKLSSACLNGDSLALLYYANEPF